MDKKEKIRLLSQQRINEIQMHLDRALDCTHGSGDHWILISLLAKYGFRVQSTKEAEELAEEIIIEWNTTQETSSVCTEYITE